MIRRVETRLNYDDIPLFGPESSAVSSQFRNIEGQLYGLFVSLSLALRQSKTSASSLILQSVGI